MQCVILAGGLGTRMKDLAKDLPKSLISVQGHPFLYYQLTWLAKQGVDDVILCIGYGGEKIKTFAEEGRPWGIKIRYSDEGTRLVGTGGALRQAYDEGLLASSFLVTYGDSFLPIDFSQVWAYFQTRLEPAMMVVLKNEKRWDKSNVEFNGKNITRYDKKEDSPQMVYIDYGLCAMRSPMIAKEIPAKTVCDLADVYRNLSKRGELAGLQVRERFYEIGSPAGLKDFDAYLLGRHPGKV